VTPAPGVVPVVHVITGLVLGGAETFLLRLLGAMDREKFPPRVFALKSGGILADRVRALGVDVVELGVRGPLGAARALGRLRRAARGGRGVLQTWMYHADLLGGLAAWGAAAWPVVWNVRQTTLTADLKKASTLRVARWCARLSGKVPRAIVCNSAAALEAHAAFGYDRARMTVIPNGFDTGVFRPDPAARASVRAELGIPADARLVGMVARWDPHKDHDTFFQAAAIAAAADPSLCFLLVGDGVEESNPAVGDALRRAGLAGRCRLLGRRDDTPRLNAALDVATLTSVSEGFPNVVGEAMACGTPCVVTRVGDAAALVGDTGRVVAPREPAALAAAWAAELAAPPTERAGRGAAARARIEAEFSLGAVARRYEALYARLAGEAA
jgi:glycosyltransferase involved in cell wall biosynthesis